MKAKLVFFSIPCTDINRAASFYKKVFNWEINIINCAGSTEQMAMVDSDGVEGCLFYHETYKPSINGSQVSFEVEDIERAFAKAIENGGKILMQKCKIDCEGKGYCAIFQDCEGNAVGLYSEK